MEPIEEIAWEVSAIKEESREFQREILTVLTSIHEELVSIRKALAGSMSESSPRTEPNKQDEEDEFTRLLNEFEKSNL